MAKELVWELFIEDVADFLGLKTIEINRNTHLLHDLGLDSLGIFSLGMKLVKVYNVNLPLAKVSSIETIGDIFSEMQKVKNGL